ncbi:MAG TPA: hypothetical protein VHJ20_16370 [Polyangia bacterium]|nr:hypothetical protein [Polyangia bacterium]
MDDDRFRTPGSHYEHEEVFAVAAVPRLARIDWSPGSYVPESTLWLPEPLFDSLAVNTVLAGLPRHEQNRLSSTTCRALAEQLRSIVFPDDSERLAASLVTEVASRVGELSDHVLLVEGP